MEAAEPATNCKFPMKLGGVLSPLEESGTHPNTYRTKSSLSMPVVLNSPNIVAHLKRDNFSLVIFLETFPSHVVY